MIKIILLASIFVSTTYLGFQSSAIFSNKTKFYQELLEFTKNIKSEISFLKTNILDLFSKYKYSTKLEKIKNQIYLAYKTNQSLSFENIKELVSHELSFDEAEINQISQMFYELGNLGYMEQIERLDYYINHYEIELKKSKDRADKMIPFCKKMGSLIGLLVCIVLF